MALEMDSGFFNNRQIMAHTKILDFSEASLTDLTHVMCRDPSLTREARKILLAFFMNHEK